MQGVIKLPVNSRKMKQQYITEALFDTLSAKAKVSERGRTNYNYHKDFSDRINRMLNVMEPGTYARPHKHEDPDKREVFLVLRGSLGMFFFDDAGNVIDARILSKKSGNHGVEVPPGMWHSLVCLEENTVAYEVKDGPYDVETDKVFATWAPAEGSDGVDEYVAFLLKQL